eukprot:m.121488 g.121488  ORF g.121488 m.121488 type:complete len:471 (-) comp14398_c0_seq5:234-1646(-)
MSTLINLIKACAESAVSLDNSGDYAAAIKKYEEALTLLRVAISDGIAPTDQLTKMSGQYEQRAKTLRGRIGNLETARPPAYQTTALPQVPTGNDDDDLEATRPISINITTVAGSDAQGGGGGSSNVTNNNSASNVSSQVADLKAKNSTLQQQSNKMKQEQKQRQEQWQKQSQWQAQFGGCGGLGWHMFLRPNLLLLLAMLFSVACFVMTMVATLSQKWDLRDANMDLKYGLAELQVGLFEYCFSIRNHDYEACYERHEIDRQCAEYFNVTDDGSFRSEEYVLCEDWIDLQGDVATTMVVAGATQLIVACVSSMGFFFVIPFPFQNPRLGFDLQYGTCTGSISSLFRIIFLFNLVGFICYIVAVALHVSSDKGFFGAKDGTDGMQRHAFEAMVDDIYIYEEDKPTEIRWTDWEHGSGFDQAVACIILSGIVTILFGNVWRHQRTGEGCCGYGKRGMKLGHMPYGSHASFYI